MRRITRQGFRAMLAGLSIQAAAAAPAAPSNLTVKPLGVNSFLMEWQDNSKTEKGWEIRVSLGKVAEPQRFLLVPVPDLTSYVVITNDLPGRTLSFQLAAYEGETGAEVFSAPSSVVTVKAMDRTTFAAPSAMTARPLDDGRVRISWKDNANSEHGYQVEFRKGAGPWKELGTENPGTTFSLPLTGLDPATRYAFRARAFKGNPAVYSAYSNVASTSTQPFLAPAMLRARPSGEGALTLSWKDRSSIEEGYEIQFRSGTGSFQVLGNVDADTSSTSSITGFALNTAYQFRIRAFRTVNSKKVFSRFSNVSSTRTTPLPRPSGLAGSALGETSLKITWNDPSSLETGFEIQSRKAGSRFFKKLATVAANITEYTATGLAAGTTHEFRIRSINTTAFSAFTPTLRLTTRDGLSGDLDPPVFWNSSFVYRIGVSRPAQLVSLTVTGLPAGLTFNRATRTISGTTRIEGVRRVTVRALFKDGTRVTRLLVLRIIRPPAAPLAMAAFAPVNLPAGTSTSVSTAGRFADPDTRSARRVSTSLGDFDIILYPLATPGTVRNFLAYANAGRFDGTFFHRAAADFVVQGGGYINDDGSGFKKVPAFPAILNEPGISNRAGTVAMAKLGGDPNSATSEFFVNLRNTNAPNLDIQNGGFTVFGRIAGNGMTVFNQINSLPRKTYSLLVDGSPRSLDDVPVDALLPPDAIDPGLLVRVDSVKPVPILRYEVTSNNPGVATAAILGPALQITGIAPGSATLRVSAIDLDGESTSQSLQVSVTAP